MLEDRGLATITFAVNGPPPVLNGLQMRWMGGSVELAKPGRTAAETKNAEPARPLRPVGVLATFAALVFNVITLLCDLRGLLRSTVTKRQNAVAEVRRI
jgi:hypothetical protein